MSAMVQANLGPPPAPNKYHKEDPPRELDDPRQNQPPNIVQQPPQLQLPRSAGIVQQQKQQPGSPHQPNSSIPHSPYASPHIVNNGIPLQRPPPYGTPTQEPTYYTSHSSTYTAASAPGQYPSNEAPDLMAASAQMQRPYPPIYHTPQSNSPASVPSPQGHDQHGRSLYSQPPQMTQGMYGYPPFPPMNPVNSAPYAPHPAAQQHSQLTSQPLLVGHQTSTAPMQHQPPPHQPHPPAMTSSPRMKLDGTPQQPTPQRTPLSASHPQSAGTPASTGHSSQQSGSNTSAAPGPIPATTPLVVRQDNNGVQWIAFEYSRDRVKMEYTIRCDVENINIEHLSPDFKTENCVYPRACCAKDAYRGNRLVYETECNAVGWALAELNPCLRGKRGLIQRAVDSWRNSNQDPRLRSRRVRRQAKLNNRKAVSSQHANHLASPAGPTHPGVPGSTPLATPPGLAIGNGQIHHHHAHPDGPPQGEDVSGTPEYSNGTTAHRASISQNPYIPAGPAPQPDLRPAQIFQGAYPNYPQPASSNTPTGPSMAPLRDSGMDHLGRPSVVSTSSQKRDRGSDDSPDNTALFGDVPEARRRKFILVEDPQRGCRVRVKVMLDMVNMKEIPDSYRKSNSVFPRMYSPVQSPFGDPGKGGRYAEEDGEIGDDDAGATVGRTLVPVPMLEGEGNLAVPKITKRKRDKEVVLNDLGYRMSWGQSRVFAGRTLFLQRSLDAYRNKMRSTMISSGQEVTSVAPHFETRVGKRKWLERSKLGKSGDDDSPAVATSASSREADEVSA